MTDTFTQTDLMNYLRDELLKISNEKKWKYSVRQMTDMEIIDAYSFFVAHNIISIPEEINLKSLN